MHASPDRLNALLSGVAGNVAVSAGERLLGRRGRGVLPVLIRGF